MALVWLDREIPGHQKRIEDLAQRHTVQDLLIGLVEMLESVALSDRRFTRAEWRAWLEEFRLLAEMEGAVEPGDSA
jgi:hypothetical protein